MTVSRSSARTPDHGVSTERFGCSRYDLILAAIPVLFVLALVAMTVIGITRLVAVGGSALLGYALLVDALYLNPPASPSAEE